MQVLINWTLMDQRYRRCGQSLLRLDPLSNVTELLGVFLNKVFDFYFERKKIKICYKRKTKTKIMRQRNVMENRFAI